jgi:hypothetical protein
MKDLLSTIGPNETPIIMDSSRIHDNRQYAESIGVKHLTAGSGLPIFGKWCIAATAQNEAGPACGSKLP